VRKRIRAAIRARLVRVVDEVVTAHRHELEASITAHRRAWETMLAAHRDEMRIALTAEIERVLKAVQDVRFRLFPGTAGRLALGLAGGHFRHRQPPRHSGC
jgi:hypothetical protein